MIKFKSVFFFRLFLVISFLNCGPAFSQNLGEFHALVAGVTAYNSPHLQQPPEAIFALDRAAKDMALALRSFARKAGYRDENICITVLVDQDKREGLGFDPLCVDDFNNPHDFLIKLKDASNPLSHWLKEQLEIEIRRYIDAYKEDRPQKARLISLTKNLNLLMSKNLIYEKNRFEKVKLRENIQNLIKQNPQGAKLFHLNRLLLEDAYPNEIVRKPANPPTVHHVLNELYQMAFKAATEKDTFVFYFTGHGSRDPEMFLYGSGANGVNDVYHIPFQKILDRFNLSNAGTKIIFIDACQTPTNRKLDNSITLLGENQLTQLKIDALDNPQGKAIFFSSAPNQVSYINDQGIGYFTQYLIEGLNKGVEAVGRVNPFDDSLYAHKLKEYLKEKINEEISSEDLKNYKTITRVQTPVLNVEANKDLFKLYEGKPRELNSRELEEKIRNSLVRIEVNYPSGQSRSGTGFYLGDRGYIFTSKTIFNDTGESPEEILAFDRFYSDSKSPPAWRFPPSWEKDDLSLENSPFPDDSPEDIEGLVPLKETEKKGIKKEALPSEEKGKSDPKVLNPRLNPYREEGKFGQNKWYQFLPEDWQSAYLFFDPKENLRVEPIGADPLFDFLLLEFSSPIRKPSQNFLKIGTPAHINNGDKLFVAGAVLNSALISLRECSLISKYSSKYVSWEIANCKDSSPINGSSDSIVDKSLLRTANFNGAPILDTYGNVVGIYIVKTEIKEEMTRFGEIKHIYQEHGISYPITFAQNLLLTSGISQ